MLWAILFSYLIILPILNSSQCSFPAAPTFLISPDNMQPDHSMFCCGNGETCKCEEFHWLDDGKSVCYECDHSISKHLQASASPTVNPPTKQSNPLPLPAPPNLPPSWPTSDTTTASMSNSKIQTIFSSLTKQESKVKYLSLTQAAAGA